MVLGYFSYFPHLPPGAWCEAKNVCIVPFMATPLKVVFSKWLLMGYFRLCHIGLGDCFAGLGNRPRRVRVPCRRIRRKATVKIRRNGSLGTTPRKGLYPKIFKQNDKSKQKKN